MKRFWRSLNYACAGLIFTFRTQPNAKIHAVFALLVLAMAFGLRIDRVQLSILVLTIGAILAAETINTIVEAIVDLLSPEWHEKAKIAKDVAAAAVLILSMTAVVIGLLILGPPLWERVMQISNTAVR